MSSIWSAAGTSPTAGMALTGAFCRRLWSRIQKAYSTRCRHQSDIAAEPMHPPLYGGLLHVLNCAWQRWGMPRLTSPGRQQLAACSADVHMDIISLFSDECLVGKLVAL